MTVLELERDSRLEGKDIQDISNYIISFIGVKNQVKEQTAIAVKEAILDSLSDMLEKMLTSNTELLKKEKIEIVHLLGKLKANKEYMQLIKGNMAENKQALSDLHTASKRMFKKSQSAFGND